MISADGSEDGAGLVFPETLLPRLSQKEDLVIDNQQAFRELLESTPSEAQIQRVVAEKRHWDGIMSALRNQKENPMNAFMQENDDKMPLYQSVAIQVVTDYIEERLDPSAPKPAYEVYVVWFTKTLQNWKAMVSATLPDGMYYEVTYNGDKREIYLDAYKRLENVTIKD